MYSIDDPLKKNATIGFINNFGQIPKQLFRKAHPCKKMASARHSVMDPNQILSNSNVTQIEKLFFHNLDNLKPSTQPIKGRMKKKKNYYKSAYFNYLCSILDLEVQ